VPILLCRSTTGHWSEYALPADGCAAIGEGGATLMALPQAGSVVVPADAWAMIVVANGQAYHISTPRSAAFKNADAAPLLPIAALHAQDRITYFGAEAATVPVRLWLLAGNTRPAAGALCGYCNTTIAAADAALVCACGDAVHESCRQHGGGRCPRCNALLDAPEAAAAWRPAGFPERKEDEDAW
jgi:hypothetical protein